MDAQALMNLIKANEEAPNFNLRTWEAPCGTYGCLWGNYCIASGTPISLNPIRESAAVLGITPSEAVFLFSAANLLVGKWGIQYESDGLPAGDSTNWRQPDDREAAIKRVRKFLYYKLHKRELCHEPDGRVKESARHTEGDHNVVRRVLAQV